eukprot:1291406-Pyramimonas_sp.AAC.1
MRSSYSDCPPPPPSHNVPCPPPTPGDPEQHEHSETGDPLVEYGDGQGRSDALPSAATPPHAASTTLGPSMSWPRGCG